MTCYNVMIIINQVDNRVKQEVIKMTNFTIYQLSPGDNIEAIASVKTEKMAGTISTLLSDDGFDVWYEPDSFERDYRSMTLRLPSVLNWHVEGLRGLGEAG